MLFETMEFIKAAADHQLSDSHSTLLSTLLAHEDEHQYNTLLHTQLPSHLHNTLAHASTLLQSSASTLWMATVLLKQCHLNGLLIDVPITLAALTLATKYQHADAEYIDYDLVVDHFALQHTQIILNAELTLLDHFAYDITVQTPDHFFSYLSSSADLDAHTKQIIEHARAALDALPNNSYQTLERLHNYPSSIVALSLIYSTARTTFIVEQIKCFLEHKSKDPSHYFTQLCGCVAQLQPIQST